MRDATCGLRLITCRDRSITVSTERESRRELSTLREATRDLSPEEFPAAVIAHALDQLEFKQKGM